MEKTYFEKSSKCTIPKKYLQYRARALFCHSAVNVIRNSNSSSVLERSFNDCTMSIDGRRVNLRDVFKNVFYAYIFVKNVFYAYNIFLNPLKVQTTFIWKPVCDSSKKQNTI